MSHNLSWQDYQAAKQSHPDLSDAKLAKQLAVSEAELNQARVGHDVQRLVANPMKLLTQLSHVGDLRAVTDNSSSAIEIIGCYKNARIDDHAGLFLNPGELDLRVFPKRWVSIFAQKNTLSDGGEVYSLHFFDEAGDAVHRVFSTPATDQPRWRQITGQYVNNDALPVRVTAPKAEPDAEQQPTRQNVEQYWRDMVDVHQFPGLLKTFGLSRQQAFNLVSDDLARKVSRDSASKLLSQAQQAGNAIMIFTGSRGCVQIYMGPIISHSEHNPLITVTGNNHGIYHLNSNDIDECWVVKKPTGDGFVTSLEIFDASGMQISQFYGSRREGEAEQAMWHSQVNGLE